MRDIFVIVDVQKDFCRNGALEVPDTESLIKPLNKTIQKAVDLDMLIIFTRDWHPENHSSFKNYGGQWPVHCVQNTPGAQFHPKLTIPDEYKIVDTGTAPDKEGYSPYEDPLMTELVNQPNIKTVYITGIALEYCVRATCLDTIRFKKKVVLIEPLTRSISKDNAVLEKYWDELTRAGIIRAQSFNMNVTSS